MVMEEFSNSKSWSRDEEKAFENALATFPEDANDRWEKIATAVPGKSIEEIKHHYELLVQDVERIDAGRVPLPSYASSSEGSAEHSNESGGGSNKKGWHHCDSGHGGKGSKSDQERRKGIAWTEDEHRLFLLGLDKYGKGDWRSISRNFVISRTPTQVASHAQKYFIRLNSMNKDRRRSSIHDITSVNNGDVSAPQRPITGQANGAVIVPGKPSKQTQSITSGPPRLGIYGTTIGQPVGGGPLVSAVGTPVLPVPGAPHMAYGIRPPIPGTLVPGAPMGITPMNYPLPHASVQR